MDCCFIGVVGHLLRPVEAFYSDSPEVIASHLRDVPIREIEIPKIVSSRLI